MTRSRLHSARRNRRWQIVTGSIVTLAVMSWIYSANWNHAVIFPFRDRMVLAGTIRSGFYGALSTNTMGSDFGDVGESPLPVDHDRGFWARYFDLPELRLDGITDTAFMIPYWVILLMILCFLYLLLPKSLPVDEGK